MFQKKSDIMGIMIELSPLLYIERMINMSSKAALYIRVSTDAQYEEGYSVDAQKEKLAAYCKLKDIDNYEFYIDGGWSGSNIKRPEMEKMIEDIKDKKINTVIVYKLDRLSRSQKDTIFLLEDVFIPNDCNFISLNENFDTTTPYGKAMIGILSVFAQLERENIRERTRMGMYERVKSGLWMGGGRVPFGYDYDPEKNILVPNEHAEDVKKIYDLYLQGYSPNKLAEMFDVANDHHITNILDRVTYTGKIQFRGEIFDGEHEAIIDESTWNMVQLERKKRSAKKTVTSEYLLTGLMYCARCGAKMRYQKWGKDCLKIYCYSQQKSRPKLIKDPNCDNDRNNAWDIEDVVLNNLFEYTKSVKSEFEKHTDTNRKTNASEIFKKKYEALANKIKRLYNLYAESGDELLLQTIKENKKELEIVQAELETANAATKEIDDFDFKTNIIMNLEESWKFLTIKEKQQVLRLCISRIIIDGSKVLIQYNF